MFDNLWTEYAFAGVYAECGDINNFATCSYDVNDLQDWNLEAVAITEDSLTEYYEAMMRIPILGLPHGDYVLIRFDPSQGAQATAEVMDAITLVQMGGLATVGYHASAGNSGTNELRFDKDAFFDDIGENCFAIVEDFVPVDFADPPRDIDRYLRG